MVGLQKFSFQLIDFSLKYEASIALHFFVFVKRSTCLMFFFISGVSFGQHVVLYFSTAHARSPMARPGSREQKLAPCDEPPAGEGHRHPQLTLLYSANLIHSASKHFAVPSLLSCLCCPCSRPFECRVGVTETHFSKKIFDLSFAEN